MVGVVLLVVSFRDETYGDIKCQEITYGDVLYRDETYRT
jgi:hypothetical protein